MAAAAVAAVRRLIEGSYTLNEALVDTFLVSIGGSIGFGIAAFAINLIWKKSKRVQSMLKAPDFSGRWVGWYRRADDDEWRPTAHEIDQSLFSLRADAWGPHNHSESVVYALKPERGLVWTYRTTSGAFPVDMGGNHDGVHVMRLVEGNTQLDGYYINNRPRNTPGSTSGSSGVIKLQRKGAKLKDCLGDVGPDWPAKPDKP